MIFRLESNLDEKQFTNQEKVEIEYFYDPLRMFPSEMRLEKELVKKGQGSFWLHSQKKSKQKSSKTPADYVPYFLMLKEFGKLKSAQNNGITDQKISTARQKGAKSSIRRTCPGREGLQLVINAFRKTLPKSLRNKGKQRVLKLVRRKAYL